MAATHPRPEDPLNALTADDVRVAGAAAGPLAGLTFVAKDLYDVAGYTTGAGSPAWSQAHGRATATAPAVERVLEAGASLVAKSHTDELAWSLLGQNAHYGTPTNPRSPGRMPGGSSSGSASASAGGLVDFALGSDTGGSVRVPAANCGIYGIRTTYGAIPADHVVPLAPSFDTVGWFAREAEVFARVGPVLLAGSASASGQGAIGEAVVAEDAFAIADSAVRQALEPAVEKLVGICGGSTSRTLSQAGLDSWASAWRTVQAREVWQVHGVWVSESEPSFGPGIRERFEWARTVTAEEEATARVAGDAARRELLGVLGGDGVALLPAVPVPALRLDATEEEREVYRTATLMLTCSAGLAGLPQVTLPAGEVEGCPVGIGVMGPAGSDLALLELAKRYELA
jgi:amidase